MKVQELTDAPFSAAEIRTPRYLIRFYEKGSGSEDTPPSKVGYAISETIVTDASDVFEVIAWANTRSGPGTAEVYVGADRGYVLYAVAEVGPGEDPTLVRVVGDDPTQPRGTSRRFADQPTQRV